MLSVANTAFKGSRGKLIACCVFNIFLFGASVCLLFCLLSFGKSLNSVILTLIFIVADILIFSPFTMGYNACLIAAIVDRQFKIKTFFSFFASIRKYAASVAIYSPPLIFSFFLMAFTGGSNRLMVTVVFKTIVSLIIGKVVFFASCLYCRPHGSMKEIFSHAIFILKKSKREIIIVMLLFFAIIVLWILFLFLSLMMADGSRDGLALFIIMGVLWALMLIPIILFISTRLDLALAGITVDDEIINGYFEDRQKALKAGVPEKKGNQKKKRGQKRNR